MTGRGLLEFGNERIDRRSYLARHRRNSVTCAGRRATTNCEIPRSCCSMSTKTNEGRKSMTGATGRHASVSYRVNVKQSPSGFVPFMK